MMEIETGSQILTRFYYYQQNIQSCLAAIILSDTVEI